jgi:hypothetical protein
MTATKLAAVSGRILFSKCYPCTGLDRLLGFQEAEAPSINRQSANEDGNVVRPTHRLPLQPGAV